MICSGKNLISRKLFMIFRVQWLKATLAATKLTNKKFILTRIAF